MGGGASVDLRTSELAELAEEKEYGRVAQIVREQKINPRTALSLGDDAIDELAEDDKIARTELRTALQHFKEATPGADEYDIARAAGNSIATVFANAVARRTTQRLRRLDAQVADDARARQEARPLLFNDTS